MPPIQQQQTSRAGLITSLVFAILIALGGIVGWVMTNADLTKAQVALSQEKLKYKDVIPADKVSDTSISTMRAEFSPDARALRTNMTLLDAAAEQRKALAKLVSGDPGSTEQAVQDLVDATYKAMKANPDIGDSIPPTNLTDVINKLSAQVSTQVAAAKASKAAAGDAATALTEAMAAHTAAKAKLEEAVTQAQAAQAETVKQTQATLAANEVKVTDFAAKADAAEKAAAEAATVFQTKLQSANQETAKVKSLYAVAIAQLAQFRPDVKESIVRNVDATVTQIAPDNICYINLGYGDHVVVGMTFEIYDKLEGVPHLNPGQNPLDMTKGKASIEIISIGQNSCQCRVLRTNTGTVMSQGDLCVNIVYDRNIKPSFFIYGKFDMDGNGVATEGEAEIIKSLITRWGGRVADKVGIDTDFVVMGKEPTVPLFTAEEKVTPVIKAKEDEAKAAVAAYDAIRLDAVGLHIPVLNQNRFLYYTGYFDTAKK